MRFALRMLALSANDMLFVGSSSELSCSSSERCPNSRCSLLIASQFLLNPSTFLHSYTRLDCLILLPVISKDVNNHAPWFDLTTYEVTSSYCYTRHIIATRDKCDHLHVKSDCLALATLATLTTCSDSCTLVMLMLVSWKAVRCRFRYLWARVGRVECASFKLCMRALFRSAVLCMLARLGLCCMCRLKSKNNVTPNLLCRLFAVDKKAVLWALQNCKLHGCGRSAVRCQGGFHAAERLCLEVFYILAAICSFKNLPIHAAFSKQHLAWSSSKSESSLLLRVAFGDVWALEPLALLLTSRLPLLPDPLLLPTPLHWQQLGLEGLLIIFSRTVGIS